MTERAKNAIRSTELKGSIQQYLPPKEVRNYFHEIDTEGKEILANTDWWQDLRMKAETGAGGWVWNWPSHAKKLDANDHVNSYCDINFIILNILILLYCYVYKTINICLCNITDYYSQYG